MIEIKATQIVEAIATTPSFEREALIDLVFDKIIINPLINTNEFKIQLLNTGVQTLEICKRKTP